MRPGLPTQHAENVRFAAALAISVRSLCAPLWEGKDAPHAYLERLGLDDATSFKTMFLRRLFAGNL